MRADAGAYVTVDPARCAGAAAAVTALTAAERQGDRARLDAVCAYAEHVRDAGQRWDDIAAYFEGEAS